MGHLATSFSLSAESFSPSITPPRSANDAVEIRYLASDAPHERALSNIALDPLTGEIRKHERYADKPVGGKLIASIFPLHSGTFFGVPGQVLYLLASLMMPVFTVTGWLLYLRRRRAKAAAQSGATQLASVETG